METVRIVENGVQAKQKIEELMMQGYSKDEIYLLAHDQKRSLELKLCHHLLDTFWQDPEERFKKRIKESQNKFSF